MVLKGPLGLWQFPLFNALFRPKGPLWKEVATVTEGQANLNTDTLVITKDTPPYTLEFTQRSKLKIILYCREDFEYCQSELPDGKWEDIGTAEPMTWGEIPTVYNGYWDRYSKLEMILLEVNPGPVWNDITDHTTSTTGKVSKEDFFSDTLHLTPDLSGPWFNIFLKGTYPISITQNGVTTVQNITEFKYTADMGTVILKIVVVSG